MANPMMASHGRGQRVDLLTSKLLGCAAVVALSLGGIPGSAQACHLRHPHPAAGAGSTVPKTPTVASAEVLNPTSLVPQAPPLTPSTAPLPIVMPATTVVPPTPNPISTITPSPLTNPPAADQITPPAAPPAVAVWHDAVPTAPANASATCGCTCPPVATPPGVANPPAGQSIIPSAPTTLPPSASSNISTPEPSTVLSALVMLGAAAAYRRRQRSA